MNNETDCGYVPFRPRQPVYEPTVQATAVALPHGAEYEPARQLLGQCSYETAIPQFENGMGSRAWLYYNRASEAKRDRSFYLMDYYNWIRPHTL